MIHLKTADSATDKNWLGHYKLFLEHTIYLITRQLVSNVNHKCICNLLKSERLLVLLLTNPVQPGLFYKQPLEPQTDKLLTLFLWYIWNALKPNPYELKSWILKRLFLQWVQLQYKTFWKSNDWFRSFVDINERKGKGKGGNNLIFLMVWVSTVRACYQWDYPV